MYICCGKYKVKTVREYMIVYPYLLFYFENEVYFYVMFKKPNTYIVTLSVSSLNNYAF